MELREFVAKTLTQVAQGVKEAQDAALESGAFVNPGGLHGSRPMLTHQGVPLQSVAFDVALTVEESGGMGGSLSVLGGLLGGSVGREDRESSVSRIKFTVPISLPLEIRNRPPEPTRQTSAEV